MITTLPICALKDNYIWMLRDTDSVHTWVVDPGDAAPVINVLSQQKLSLSGILITHHHHDHSGGINDLIKYAGPIPVYGSHQSPLKNLTAPLNDGNEIMLFSKPFQTLAIPGHTLDHIAYYGNDSLFCGDTLFSAGCGRIFEGTPAQMYDSLSRIANLPDETHIYCGHEYTLNNLYFAQHVDPNNKFIAEKINKIERGDFNNGCTLPSLLGEEKKINPFLRCQMPDVIQSVEKHAGKTMQNVAEVFQYLREWKNNFIAFNPTQN